MPSGKGGGGGGGVGAEGTDGKIAWTGFVVAGCGPFICDYLFVLPWFEPYSGPVASSTRGSRWPITRVESRNFAKVFTMTKRKICNPLRADPRVRIDDARLSDQSLHYIVRNHVCKCPPLTNIFIFQYPITT
jgi:hypothetical protein